MVNEITYAMMRIFELIVIILIFKVSTFDRTIMSGYNWILQVLFLVKKI